MSAIASKKKACEAMETKHKVAAKKLIQEVRRDYEVFVQGKASLDFLFMRWGNCMKGLRLIEKGILSTGAPSEEKLKSHRELAELLISFSATISLSAERHLQNNDPLDEAEKASLKEKIDLVKRHRKILEFEFKGWHGQLSREKLEEVSQRISGVTDSKAA